MKGRGRRAAAVVMGLSLLLLGAGAYLFRAGIEEEWRLHQLRSASREERAAAVESLGRIGAARAVRPLLETYAVECRNRGTFSGYQMATEFPEKPLGFRGQVMSIGGKDGPDTVERAYAEAILTALLEIVRRGGQRAFQELLSGLDHEVWDVRCFTVDVLAGVGPRAQVLVPRLIEMIRGPGPRGGMLTRDAAMDMCIFRALSAIGEPRDLIAPALERLTALAQHSIPFEMQRPPR
jgi:hypothetical protein